MELFDQISKNSLFYSSLERNKTSVLERIKLTVQTSNAASQNNNKNNLVFGFNDIGREAQNLLENFFPIKFLAEPYTNISDKAYKTILDQTVC